MTEVFDTGQIRKADRAEAVRVVVAEHLVPVEIGFAADRGTAARIAITDLAALSVWSSACTAVKVHRTAAQTHDDFTPSIFMGLQMTGSCVVVKLGRGPACATVRRTLMGMPVTGGPFAEKKFIEIKGRKMAYIDEGEGPPIVFQHGNPTSSYLWRKVMPVCAGLGRLVACDLIGMGDSEKLPDSGPDRYTYVEQREFLFALWEELGLERDVVLVIHDWGATLGFDWAFQHADRLQGIAYMEAPVLPLSWGDFPNDARDLFAAFRSPAGEDMVLRDNVFIEAFLIDAEEENLSEADMAEYRRPFLNAGEDRRPMLSWPRQIPLDGSPPEVAKIKSQFCDWLQGSAVPKLWVRANPGFITNGRVAAFCEGLQNQTEVRVKGGHHLQESSGPEIGQAVADFVRELRH